MPADDSLFEKALARQMRNPAAADGEGVPNAASEARRDPCPDAEVLAAYHERSLPSDEMISWKEHIASCARCQDVLGALEATDDILVNADADGQMAEMADKHDAHLLPIFATPMSLARSGAAKAVPTAILPHLSTLPAPAAAVATVAPPAARRRPANRWILSAAAIAAVVLVSIGVATRPRQKSPRTAMPSPQNEPQLSASNVPAPVPPAQQNAAPQPISRIGQEPKQKDLSDETGRDTTTKGERGRAPSQTSELKGTLPGAAALSQSVQKKSRGAFAGGNAVASAPAPALPSASGSAQQSVEVSGQIVEAASPTTDADLDKVMKESDKAAALPAPVTAALSSAPTPEEKAANAELATAVLNAQSETNLKMMHGALGARPKLPDPRLIAAPGGNVIWRVGAAGRIEQSMDAGATWKLQTSGVDAALRSGSAPSASVCWVAGTAGTILRTVDGGGHWTKLVSPLAGNLGRILAVDDLHAAVWDSTGYLGFATYDGGTTWAPLEKK